ncbi:hypothetical protein ACILDU_05915 [Capnocytophaga canimorsus]|uniref:Phosphoribosyltransferase domain-containing protein n=1 Tax=Capnocytophaga canis TaxID=1848903 RepID=A0A3A1YCG6_9FLAO|nr:hypothetical protein [Capnocytophaga canis]RIY35066.1 hypothetical protein CKY20_11405 [Capnocytophaga canis]
MHFEFFTLLVYSPRGSSENAEKSRRLIGVCKNGDTTFARTVARKIQEINKNGYFYNSALIPAPRSAPLAKGAILPTGVLAECLVSNGLGNVVYECIQRIVPIPKSSSQYTAETRNSVQTHLQSLKVESMMIAEPTLIIIDDVLTLGRTTMACAIKLKEIYPNKEIKIFCPFRTRGFEDKNILMDDRYGSITLSPNGKVILPD